MEGYALIAVFLGFPAVLGAYVLWLDVEEEAEPEPLVNDENRRRYKEAGYDVG